MPIESLFMMYEHAREQKPDSINNLLDFFQERYIAEEIDIKDYRAIFSHLHEQGAISAHEYV